ncbi:hypothetical protein cym2001_15740 [Pseudomonas sp. CYM-20-01]|uniref:hypothetical protein n=1 Tax=Pseudomonas sp. CYM-20-01 TaxID=2870750 RepID=UPI002053D814|nr:hypothetical protein [Pseudomonas sp. CYM-20-01]BDB18209.1 hypothetical protein cym2001_15740 [Pseudomonas sp. CYM-20-01]
MDASNRIACATVFSNSRYTPDTPPQLAFTPDNPVQAHRHPFLDDGNLKAGGQSVWEYDFDNSLSNSLILETGDKADQVHISQTLPGQLDVKVNGHTVLHGGADNDRLVRPTSSNGSKTIWPCCAVPLRANRYLPK